jgi:hypothetical protein
MIVLHAHHEIGHALFFNATHTLFGTAKTAGQLSSAALIAYHSSGLKIDSSDHFKGEIDDASQKGVFGFEYFGNVPRKRWIITKLDLLAIQAIGYKLRPTSAFAPLTLVTTSLVSSRLSQTYSSTLQATGGIPFYCWDLTAGELPPGLKLDTFTGSISGPTSVEGTFNFTVRARDYVKNSACVSRSLSIFVGNRRP